VVTIQLTGYAESVDAAEYLLSDRDRELILQTARAEFPSVAHVWVDEHGRATPVEEQSWR